MKKKTVDLNRKRAIRISNKMFDMSLRIYKVLNIIRSLKPMIDNEEDLYFLDYMHDKLSFSKEICDTLSIVYLKSIKSENDK